MGTEEVSFGHSIPRAGADADAPRDGDAGGDGCDGGLAGVGEDERANRRAAVPVDPVPVPDADEEPP